MTVSTTTIRVSYTGDGSSVNFAVTFPFYLSTDLLVLLNGSALSSGYSVSGGNGSTGTLTMASPPAVGAGLQIILNVPLTQLTNLVDGTAFPSLTINQVNDRSIQAALRLQDQISRSIRAPDGDISPGMILPAKAQRISQYLATDANGNITTTAALPGTANTQASLGPILSPQTPAEVSAGVTPVNYVLPTAYIDARRYGCDPAASATVNTTAINNALAVAAKGPGGIVVLPSGQIAFNGTLNVGSNTALVGNTKGFGVNYSTSLYYTGSGIAIQIGTPATLTTGLYSRLANFTLKQAGSGTIGIAISAVQIILDSITVVPDFNTGFNTGIQTDPDITNFTHLYRDVYVYGCGVGLDLSRGNNFTLDHCFLESNGTNLRIGHASQCTNVTVCNGTVIELFGDGRPNETNTSISVNVFTCLGLVIRDSYFEVDGTGTPAASGQLGINIQSASGVVIEGNYLYGGGQAVTIINLQSCTGVVIDGNHFQSVNGYGVSYTTASVFDIGANSFSIATGVWNNTFTPTPTALTVVPGTGGVSYSGTWNRANGRVTFTIQITITGTCTTASTANTTYFSLASLPTPSNNDVVSVVAADVSNYGTGYISALSSRCYTPTWSAKNANIVISGSYAV